MTKPSPFDDFDDAVPQDPQSGQIARNDAHDLALQDSQFGQIVRVDPKYQPFLTQEAVIWESEIVIDPKGKKFTSEDLHDCLKLRIDQDKLPVNLFFAKQACWIILGAKGNPKIDSDRRPRIVATLQNSPYDDIQFIAGIDYFGQSDWANVQMMMIVQPTEGESAEPRPARPQEPSVQPIIPNEALIPLGLIAAFLLFSGNSGVQVLGLLGAIGTLVIYLLSNTNINIAKQSYLLAQQRYQKEASAWEERKEQIRLDLEERRNNRLLRSFKWDDLRLFKKVINSTVLKVIYEQLIQEGAVVKDYQDITNDPNIIAKSDKKNPFSDFAG